jgi:hypothetical protein
MVSLHRVGTPSIGETYPFRFNAGRGSGGWGTGMYAYRDHRPAKVKAQTEGKELYLIENALDNPVEPSSLDQTWEIHRFSVGLMKFSNEHGDLLEHARRVESDEVYYPSYTTSAFGVDSQTTLHSHARKSGLSYVWGADTDEMVAAGLRAMHEAEGCADSRGNRVCSQPINRMLWDEGVDGIAPTDGAGGNRGDIGCIVFRERIEECVPGELGLHETVDADVLNDCFADR